MFSDAPRCIYAANPLLEVVCQLRFPTILKIESELPAEFQDAVREVFPQYACRKETPAPKLVPVAGQQPRLENQPPVSNYSFSTPDGAWRINLTQNFIALTAQKYTRWEDFARMLDRPLAQFIRLYAPSYFDRIGLRYVNAVSRKSLDLEDTPWRELIEPEFLGLLSDEALPEQGFARCTQDAELALPAGCRLKLHAGPGMVQRTGAPADRETKYLLDFDLSMSGNVPVNFSAGAMNTLHTQAYGIFRSAITDRLHEAMEPGEV